MSFGKLSIISMVSVWNPLHLGVAGAMNIDFLKSADTLAQRTERVPCTAVAGAIVGSDTITHDWPRSRMDRKWSALAANGIDDLRKTTRQTGNVGVFRSRGS